ncbi:unnamed protein product [Brachionus calyciflorus]|uniref:Potassium channel tetramerisation-type BTB domain-containing protein n=1 Tax=Brachionus calyciflorus TaxID=104777 RepID=A0A814CKW6_9BILA|nr:unnamed protein product [Brachionus calyciflorus]
MKKNKTSSMTKISDSFYSSDSKTSPDITINIYKHSKEYRLKRLYGTKKIHVNSLESNVEVNMDDLIRLNIGGARYVTYMSTLRKIPNSRLSELDKTDDNYDIKNNEYFFDRSPLLFDYILNFYRTGELHVPLSECGSAFSNAKEAFTRIFDELFSYDLLSDSFGGELMTHD